MNGDRIGALQAGGMAPPPGGPGPQPMGAPAGGPPMGGMPEVIQHGKAMLDAFMADPSEQNRVALEAVVSQAASLLQGGEMGGAPGPTGAGPAPESPAPAGII